MTIKTDAGVIIGTFNNYQVSHIETNCYQINGTISFDFVSASQLTNVILEEKDSRGNIIAKYKGGMATHAQGRRGATYIEIQALVDG